jgi:hypothetical protein
MNHKVRCLNQKPLIQGAPDIGRVGRMRIALKTMAVVLIAVSMIALATTAALASNGNGPSHDKTPKTDEMWKDKSGLMQGDGDWNGKDVDDSQTMEHMLSEGMKHGFFGRFNYSGGVMNGRFVAFDLNESDGMIKNFSMKSANGPITVFDEVVIDGFAPTNISVHGSVMFIRNGTMQIVIHDNPTGMLHIISNRTVSVSFKLADGLQATKVVSSFHNDDDLNLDTDVDDHNETSESENVIASDDMTGVIISGNGLLAFLATDQADLTMDSGGSGTFVNTTINNDHLIFRAMPVFSKHHRLHDEAVMNAIEQRRVVSETYIIVHNGSAYVETMEYERSFTMTVKEAQKGHLLLQVSSETHSGRVVIINVDQQTLDVLKDQLNVKLDGAGVRSTTNPLEVLYATGSTPSDAVYCVTESNNSAQLMIYVPSFSVHSISVESQGPLAQVMGLAGMFAVIAALAIVVGAAFLLLRKHG